MDDIKHLAGVCVAFVLCAFVAATAWQKEIYSRGGGGSGAGALGKSTRRKMG